MTDEENLMKTVRALRGKLGLTQLQMAHKMGLTPSTIYRYEVIRPPKGPALIPFLALAEQSNLPELAETLRAPLEEMAKLLQGEYSDLFSLFMRTLTAVSVIKDVGGTILWANPAYEQLSGWKLADLKEKKAFDVWPKKFADKIIAMDKEVIAKKKPFAFIVSVPVRGRQYLRFTVRFPILNDTGKDVVMVGALGWYWSKVKGARLTAGQTISLAAADEVTIQKRRP